MRILFIYFYLRLKNLNIYYIFKYIYINYQVSQNPKNTLERMKCTRGTWHENIHSQSTLAKKMYISLATLFFHSFLFIYYIKNLYLFLFVKFEKWKNDNHLCTNIS